MPIYEYHCDECGDFDVMQKITANPLRKCPTCKSRVTKLISSTAFQLKGSGWYVTDYANKDKAAPSESSESKSESSTSESSTSESSTSDSSSASSSAESSSSASDKKSEKKLKSPKGKGESAAA